MLLMIFLLAAIACRHLPIAVAAILPLLMLLPRLFFAAFDFHAAYATAAIDVAPCL